MCGRVCCYVPTYKNIELPDRITKVLASNPHGGPGHADDHGHLVVQLESPIINVDLIKLEIVCHLHK